MECILWHSVRPIHMLILDALMIIHPDRAVYFMWVFILYSRNLLNHLQEWSYFIEMVAVC